MKNLIATLIITLPLSALATGPRYPISLLTDDCVSTLRLGDRDDFTRADLINAMLYTGLSAEDVALKKEKLTTAFVFMRATADLYYFDLSHTPWLRNFVFKYSQLRNGSPLISVISADNHIANIDLANVSDIDPLAQPRMVMTRNDFDEVFLGYWSADVLRLASSIVHFGREGGWSDNETRTVVERSVTSFLATIQRIDEFRRAGRDESEIDDELELNHAHLEGIARKHLEKIERKKNHGSALKKWAEEVDGRWQFQAQEDRFRPLNNSNARAQAITAALKEQSPFIAERMGLNSDFFELIDFGQRLGAGAGSMGVERYYSLIEGFESKPPVILDIKEQPVPAAMQFLPNDLKFVADIFSHGFGDNHALRVMRGSGFMSLDANPIWGWIVVPQGNGQGKYFTVSQVSPFKSGFPLEKLHRPKKESKLEKIRAELDLMAQYWGQVTALGQSRSDDDLKRSLAARGALVNGDFSTMPLTQLILDVLEGRQSQFITDLTNAAFTYADQNEADFALLQ